mmetsp:Transcript_16923/g.52002  ORF Transcript_16923/g.52002 Transcript_16923/m.52002 type:complete len:96 (+) Transcript_16923:682-969(+)
MYKLALIAAVAVPATASGALRGGRGLTTDDFVPGTCRDSYERFNAFLNIESAEAEGAEVDEANGCVNYPSIYAPSGYAWRVSTLGFRVRILVFGF